MRVFISGPMSGHPNYFDAFLAAEKKLEEAGYFVIVNPADIFDRMRKAHGDEKFTREYCNKLAISWLLGTDAIYSLEGWENSEGAKLERFVAESCGLEIVELEDK